MNSEVLAWPFTEGKTVIDGKLLIKNKIAIGGMGRVYAAEHLALERLCVLKLLLPELHPYAKKAHPDARELLRNEAKILGLLAANSDSFVTVFDTGTALVAHPLIGSDTNSRSHVSLDLPYYVMELLDGCNLQNIVGNHRQLNAFLPWSIVLNLSAQAARALSIAHAKNIIHRDIKPNNIYLHDRIDRNPVIKFIDFGVSTRQGDVGMLGTGTRQYGAPELLRQNRTVLVEDTQSDIYPLALVIYELAALVGPFVPPDRIDARLAGQFYADAHIHEIPPLLSTHRPDAPPKLVALLHAALGKDPSARPTALEMAAALEEIAADGAGADAQISALLSTMRERKRPRVAARSTNHHAVTTRGVTCEAGSDLFFKPSSQVHEPTTTPGSHDALPIAAMPVVIVGGNGSDAGGQATVDVTAARDAIASAPAAYRVVAPAQTLPMARGFFIDETDPDGEQQFDTDPMLEPVLDDSPVEEALAAVEGEVPIYSSMAGVFDGWQDTLYRSSPLTSRDCAHRPRPNSSLNYTAHVPVLDGAPAPPAGASAPTPSASEPRSPTPEPERSRRPRTQRSGARLPSTWAAVAVSFAIASSFGVWRISRGSIGKEASAAGPTATAHGSASDVPASATTLSVDPFASERMPRASEPAPRAVGLAAMGPVTTTTATPPRAQAPQRPSHPALVPLPGAASAPPEPRSEPASSTAHARQDEMLREM